MQKRKIAASYKQFHVIAHDLNETEDLKAECKKQLGEGVRLADWNDIVAYVEAGGSLDDFIEALKIPLEYVNPEDMKPIPNTSYRISMNGKLHWMGDRHYFFARHDHKLRGDFLAHSNLEDYTLSLGSWFGKGGFALCFGDPDSTVAPPEPEIIVSDVVENLSITDFETDTENDKGMIDELDSVESLSITDFESDTTEPELTHVVSYQKFHVFTHNLSERGDLKSACPEKLGIGVRLADWNDIVAYVESGGSLKDFIEALKIPLEYVNPEDMEPIPNTSYRISMNGKLHWMGDRHYFFARHDHKLRGDFLAHSNLEDYTLSLGSWFGKGGFALCFGDLNGTVAPPEPEIKEPVQTSGG